MDTDQVATQTRRFVSIRRRLGGLALAGLLVGGAGGGAVAQGAGAGPGPGPAGPSSRLALDGRPSIAVVGSGGASAPAERGRIQLVLRAIDPYATVVAGDVVPGVGPNQPPPLAEAQVRPVVGAVVAGGAPVDAVAVIVAPAFGGGFGPGSAQVLIELDEATMDQAAALVEAATTAAGFAGLYVESVGAGYGIDACEALLRDARARAADDGRERAEAVAEALDVELGGLLLASEVPGYNDGSGYGCPTAVVPPAPYQGLYLPTFDPTTEPAVTAYVQFELAYAVAEPVEDTPEA